MKNAIKNAAADYHIFHRGKKPSVSLDGLSPIKIRASRETSLGLKEEQRDRRISI